MSNYLLHIEQGGKLISGTGRIDLTQSIELLNYLPANQNRLYCRYETDIRHIGLDIRHVFMQGKNCNEVDAASLLNITKVKTVVK